MFRIYSFLAVFVWSSFACAYRITPEQITLSGLSSGAYMAGQMHLAYSENISAVALLAGGPYYCAQSDLNTALADCTDDASNTVSNATLLRQIRELEKSGSLAPLSHLKKSKVFILSGQLDRTVLPVLSERSRDLYLSLGLPSENIYFKNDLPMGHAFPTANFGNPCESVSTSPYISNCGYDAAGEILKNFYPNLQPKGVASENNYFWVSQKERGSRSLESLSLAERAIAYIPPSCQSGRSCGLHVVFHGCRQTLEDVGYRFVTELGYNDWAESNRMIILYPQAIKSQWPYNPRGCWDWWGYSGVDYHTRSGKQLQVIKNLIDKISRPSYQSVSKVSL